MEMFCVLWATLVLQAEPSSERWSMLLGFQNLGFTLRLEGCHVESTSTLLRIPAILVYLFIYLFI